MYLRLALFGVFTSASLVLCANAGADSLTSAGQGTRNQHALAFNTCGGGHCYATVRTYSPDSSWGGGAAHWETRANYAIDWEQGGFAAQVMWVGVSGHSGNWLEIGWTHGWSSQNERTLYWAGGYPYREFKVDSPSVLPFGSSHVYELQQYDADRYRAYVDNDPVGLPNANGWTDHVTVGIEATDRFSTVPLTHVNTLQTRSRACCDWNPWRAGTTTQYENSSAYEWLWTDVPTAGTDQG